MRWSEFVAACVEIGDAAERRFRADELVFLGTVRPDGSARVSPCELDFVDGELMLGMMWRSQKALDLQRDPRLTVHSATADRMNPGGDVKLRGTAREVTDPLTRERYCDVLRERIDWAPDEPEFHVFAFDVEHAAYLRFGDAAIGLVWSPTTGLRHVEVH
jgi:Pyridoxamine 5'-phosphate oxidase